MMWWDGAGWGFGQWLAMTLMMAAFWGLLVGLVVWLVRGSRTEADPASRRQPEQRAEDLLAERFARGEIDEAEFAHRRQVLHSTGRS